MLDRMALSTVNRAQDFIHRYILPTLPERRIAVRIEDAVLALIADRAGAVAESFSTAMQPVAARMGQTAERCAKAAEAATNAFSEAVRALREAGDLGTASSKFKSGAHMIDSSAEQLSDATKQTAEVVLRVGEMRASYGDLLRSIQEAAESLGAVNNRVSGELGALITEFGALGVKIQASVEALQSAINALSADLARYAAGDSAHLEAIRRHVEAAGGAVAAISEIARDSSGAVKVLSVKIEEIGTAIADGVRQGVAAGSDDFAARLARRLDTVTSQLDHSARSLSEATARVQAQPDKASGSIPVEFTNRIHDAAAEIKRASEECRKLTEAVQDLRSSVDQVAREKKGDGFFRRLFRS